MAQTTRAFRSVLYIPGSNARALEKARGLQTDAIIFDLEDVVAPDAKAAARDTLAAALNDGGYDPRYKLVRVNGLDTKWFAADASVMASADADAILLPKVGRPQDIDAAAQALPNADFWAMIETPAGVLNADAIATHPKMKGFVLGTNDLAKDLGCRFRADRLPLMTSLQISLLAARNHGIVAVDGVYNAFKDEAGLRDECEQGRDMGFDGKTLIHPAQLAVANEVFAPTHDEIVLARRQIAAYEDAAAQGKGVAVVDGKIVENLHVATAKATLAKADAIAALEGTE